MSLAETWSREEPAQVPSSACPASPREIAFMPLTPTEPRSPEPPMHLHKLREHVEPHSMTQAPAQQSAKPSAPNPTPTPTLGQQLHTSPAVKAAVAQIVGELRTRQAQITAVRP